MSAGAPAARLRPGVRCALAAPRPALSCAGSRVLAVSPPSQRAAQTVQQSYVVHTDVASPTSINRDIGARIT